MSRIEWRIIGLTMVFGGLLAYWVLDVTETRANIIIATGALIIIATGFTIKRD